jgi:hypothetical protein
VVLSAVGLTMWTRWESEYDAEAAYTVLTPKRRETAMLKDGGAGGGAIDDDDEEDDAGAGGAEAGAAGFQGGAAAAAHSGAAKGAAQAGGSRGAWASHHGVAMVAPSLGRARPEGVELLSFAPKAAAGVRAAATGALQPLPPLALLPPPPSPPPPPFAGGAPPPGVGERTGLLAAGARGMRKSTSSAELDDEPSPPRSR